MSLLSYQLAYPPDLEAGRVYSCGFNIKVPRRKAPRAHELGACCPIVSNALITLDLPYLEFTTLVRDNPLPKGIVLEI
jgi:hypothetical protein